MAVDMAHPQNIRDVERFLHSLPSNQRKEAKVYLIHAGSQVDDIDDAIQLAREALDLEADDDGTP